MVKFGSIVFLLFLSLGSWAQTINGWTNMSGASISIQNGMLAITKTGGGQMGVSKQASAPLGVGFTYEFTAIIDKGTCNASSGIEARIVDSGGQIIVSQQFFASGQQNLSTTFTVPVNGTYFMEFERIGSSSNCTFYINKIKLVQIETITEVCTVPVGEYRYGFNGMEKDDEVKGKGNSYDFKARMYDPRLGRFLSMDPRVNNYPSMSPYVFVANNPIVNVDLDGKDVIVSPKLQQNNQLGKMQKVLSKTRAYKKLIKRFDDNDNTLNLAIGYNPNPGGGAVADTYYFNNDGQYKDIFGGNDFHGIRFFTFDVRLPYNNEVVGQKTFDQTVLAGTLIHELIHANLDSYLEQDDLDCEEIDKQYKGLNQYIDDYGFTEQAQHEYMAANSRGDIAKAMKKFDRKAGNKIKSKEWYDAVSWYGLRANDVNGEIIETEAWKEFKANATEEQIKYVEEVLASPEVLGKFEETSGDSE